MHPDHVVAPAAFERMPLLEPLYPLSAGVPGRILAKAIGGALDQLPDLAEWQDPAWLAARGWPSLKDALLAIHRPADPDGTGPLAPARLRLAYDELLANQLAWPWCAPICAARGAAPLAATGSSPGACSLPCPIG